LNVRTILVLPDNCFAIGYGAAEGYHPLLTELPMPKKFIKRYLPTPEKMQAMESLRFLGDIRHEPNLWHINRHSVARAFLIGIWFCMIPMPFQMVAAGFFAIWFNANLPLSVALVWISNPITMPFMYYVAYELGAFLLNQSQHIQFNFHSMYDNFDAIALSLYTGSFVLGTICSILAVVVINFLWIHTVKHNRKSHFSHRTST
jgi:uncharacterized protein (DUF2062 family)